VRRLDVGDPGKPDRTRGLRVGCALPSGQCETPTRVTWTRSVVLPAENDVF
jgi:hypothetical protein